MGKVASIIAVIFGIISTIGLLITLFFIITTATFISQAATADGSVIAPQNPSPGRKYTSEIEFTTASGQTVQFQTGVSSSPPEFQYGQLVRVYYKPEDPQGSARPDSYLSLWFLPTLFGGLSLLFGLIAGGFGLAVYTAWKKRRWLEQHGRRITAHITGVDVNRSISTNGKHPYFVIAQWTDPNTEQIYNFKSESFWFDPNVFSPNQPVEVLVDPANYARHYVIISDPTKAQKLETRS